MPVSPSAANRRLESIEAITLLRIGPTNGIVTHMKPNFDNLRACRDFLASVFDSTPDEATDLLTNHGIEELVKLNEALGDEAFKKGDNVLASPEAATFIDFMAIVIDVKSSENEVLFTVRDQDGDCWDCEAGELRPDLDS